MSWEMGSPQNPSRRQYVTLEQAGLLHKSGKTEKIKTENGILTINTTLQRQGVGLIIISS